MRSALSDALWLSITLPDYRQHPLMYLAMLAAVPASILSFMGVPPV